MDGIAHCWRSWMLNYFVYCASIALLIILFLVFKAHLRVYFFESALGITFTLLTPEILLIIQASSAKLVFFISCFYAPDFLQKSLTACRHKSCFGSIKQTKNTMIQKKAKKTILYIIYHISCFLFFFSVCLSPPPVACDLPFFKFLLITFLSR